MLNEIESWAKDPNKSPVFWMDGIAGTGKSTIAQTIAERLFADGTLGASFFCSRDFEDRSNLHFIFPTLSFQLAHKYPDFRSRFVSLLRSNPDVAHESLYSQMQKLIAEPLRNTGISTVIVIDALDECKDDEPSSAILSVLGRFVQEIPEVKFFITGRPEPRIKTGFRLPLLVDSTRVFVLHDVHPSLVDNDIRIFLKHDLSELGRRRRLERWPSDEHIEILCRRAAGLFVYAAATVKFLDSNTHLPDRRLDVIMKLPESTVLEGKTRFNHGSTLDSLYTSIFQAAFSEEDPEVDSKVRTTVGAVVVVVNPLPPPAIAELIGLEHREVTLYLGLVQSLLAVDEGSGRCVQPFHKSFPDFITDPSRCDPRFLVSTESLHLQLATGCMILMNTKLERDLLLLPEYALNSEIEDLQARIGRRISVGLQYACRSWHNHLAETRGDIGDLISHVRVFVEEKFLAWLEVLSVLGGVGSASVALEKLMVWLEEVCISVLRCIAPSLHRAGQIATDNQLLDVAQDCFRFVTRCFEPISLSATHIYHSALELCPISSIVWELYYDQCHGTTRFPRVVMGALDSWDPTISVSGENDYESCTWSPCGRFVAAQTIKSVEIRSQLTFELITSLRSAYGLGSSTGPLAYSPDGRSLARGFPDPVVICDIQTGGVAKEIKCDWDVATLTWSLDGMTIATTTYGHGRSTPGVRTYDVASGAQLFVEESESPATYSLWASEKSFRFMKAVSSHPTHKISIFEIGPPFINIESFDVTGVVELPSYPPITFCPPTHHVAILRYNTLTILDIRSSGRLLEQEGSFTSSKFSPDGSFFAASHKDGIRVWKHSSGTYISWGESPFPYLPSWFRNTLSLQFSPTSSSILSLRGNVLQVRCMQDLPTTPKMLRRFAAVSRSGRHVATAHLHDTTVTISDFYSQAPVQFVDPGFKLVGLLITGNVLLVVGSGKVVAWLLTEEGVVDVVPSGGRIGRGNSIWTMSVPAFGYRRIRFRVEGQVGVIEVNDPFLYHTETGNLLELVHMPSQFSCPWIYFYDDYRGQEQYYLRCHNPSQHGTPPEDGWLFSHNRMEEIEWVVDPEGRRRFWVPVDWRKSCSQQNWHQDITSLFIRVRDQPIIIKF